MVKRNKKTKQKQLDFSSQAYKIKDNILKNFSEEKIIYLKEKYLFKSDFNLADELANLRSWIPLVIRLRYIDNLYL